MSLIWKRLKCFFSVVVKKETVADETKIDSFEPVGCFKDKRRPRAFSNWIKRFKELFNGSRSNASIKAIIHACAEIVSKEYGFRYFGIQHVHECWSGRNGGLTYKRYGKSDNCDYGVGMKWANFVYRFVQGQSSTPMFKVNACFNS